MVAANLHLPQKRRSLLWGFIVLLLALAVLRSLAPERTERAVRRLLDTRADEQAEIERQKKTLDKLKEDLQRERKALERWKEELGQKRERIRDEEAQSNSERKEVALSHDDPGAYGDEQQSQGDTSEHTQPEEDVSATDEQRTDAPDDSRSDPALDLADAPAETLADEECPIIVAPESTAAGLGTQIEHIWTSISLTLAVRNACMVIPPIVSFDNEETHRPVPFHQVFNLQELSRTGLRFVPLRTCQKHGIGAVFDDSGAESAIVKNFAAYVSESHPRLVKETTLVHGDSKGHRFLPTEQVNQDVTVVAQYIREKLPQEKGRKCVGMGRMRAPVAINPDVLEHFAPAQEVADYIDEKFSNANEILFAKLRWNKGHCDEVRTENGTVCALSGTIVPIDEFVSAIAHAASLSNAKSIYLSLPTHIPDDVSEYFAASLITLDPVLLDVYGDFFTANVIERELAVRSVKFIPDGGAWGDVVQKSRASLFPDLFEENVNSLNTVQAWREAGRPKQSPFLQGNGVNQIDTPIDQARPGPAEEPQPAQPDAVDHQLAESHVEQIREPPLDTQADARDHQRTEPPVKQIQEPPPAAQPNVVEHQSTGRPTEEIVEPQAAAQEVAVDHQSTAPVHEVAADTLPATGSQSQKGQQQNRQMNSHTIRNIGEQRPKEYVPPPNYVPSADDNDNDIHQFLGQGASQAKDENVVQINSAQKKQITHAPAPEKTVQHPMS